MKDDIPLGAKIAVIIIPALVVWAMTFGFSLLFSRDKPLINLIITFVMTLLSSFAVFTMEGEEYDPDRMP